jgi:predicted transcriptional regulator
MTRRSRVDIAAAILRAAEQGKIRTRIMYNAHISSAQLIEYLEVLMQHEMIEQLAGGELYRTTEKGRLFLESYQEVWHVLHYTKEKMGRQKNKGSHLHTTEAIPSSSSSPSLSLSSTSTKNMAM